MERKVSDQPRMEEIGRVPMLRKHGRRPGEERRPFLERGPEHPDQRAEQDDERQKRERVEPHGFRAQAPAYPRPHRGGGYSRPDRSCSQVTTKRKASRKSGMADAEPKGRNANPCIQLD